MRIGVVGRLSIVLVPLCAVTMIGAQEPAGGRGGGQGQGRGGRGPAPDQAPAVRQISRSPVVDQAAHDRGRALWASHCIDCHGSQARGSDTGPNIIRTKTVNYDRSAEVAGSVLGPFLKAGHPTQSKKPSASFIDEEIVGLANFLRQRVNDTMRGSPLFDVGDIVVGDPKAGETYFNGEGGCAACHNATTNNLAGVATRIPLPVDLQQRMLFPGSGGRGRGRGGRGAPGGPAAVDRNAVRVEIVPAGGRGQSVSGVLVEESDFHITVRGSDGTVRAVRRTPGMKVTRTNPLQAHIDLLDRVSDKQIHDLVAYLETMK
jgi:mono/diheme cytochrome c family protein